MNTRTQNAENARAAFEAMADKIAGNEITSEQQNAIAKATAARNELRDAISAAKN